MKFDFEMLQPEKWNEYILTNIFVMFFIVLIILYEIYFSYMNSKEMEYLKPYYFLMLLLLFPISWLISYVQIFYDSKLSYLKKGFIVYLISSVVFTIIIELFNTIVEIIAKERKRSKHKDDKYAEEQEDIKEETTDNMFVNFCKKFVDSDLPIVKGIDKSSIRYIMYVIYSLIFISSYYAYTSYEGNEIPSFTKGIGWLLSQPFNFINYSEDSFINFFSMINVSHLLKVFIIFAISFITILFSVFLSVDNGNIQIYNLPEILNDDTIDNLFTYDTVINVVLTGVIILLGYISYPSIKFLLNSLNAYDGLFGIYLKCLLVLPLFIIFMFTDIIYFIPFISYLFTNTDYYESIVSIKLFLLITFILVCFSTPIILFILQLITETGIFGISTLNTGNILSFVGSLLFILFIIGLFSAGVLNEWYKDNTMYKLYAALIISIFCGLIIGFTTNYKVITSLIKTLYNIVLYLVVPFIPIILCIFTIIRMTWKFNVNKSLLRKTDG
jgi:hypothetical protein